MGRARSSRSSGKGKPSRDVPNRKSLCPAPKSSINDTNIYESFPIIPRFSRSRGAETKQSQYNEQIILGGTSGNKVKVTTTVRQTENKNLVDPGNPLGNTINYVVDYMPSFHAPISFDVSSLLKTLFEGSVDEKLILDLLLWDVEPKQDANLRSNIDPCVEEACNEESLMNLNPDKKKYNWAKKTMKNMPGKKLLRSMSSRRGSKTSKNIDDLERDQDNIGGDAEAKDNDVATVMSCDSEDSLFSNLQGIDIEGEDATQSEHATNKPNAMMDKKDELTVLLSQLPQICHPKIQNCESDSLKEHKIVHPEEETVGDVPQGEKSVDEPKRTRGKVPWKRIQAFKILSKTANMKSRSKSEPEEAKVMGEEDMAADNLAEAHELIVNSKSPPINKDIVQSRSRSILSQQSVRLLRKKRLKQAFGLTRKSRSSSVSFMKSRRQSWKMLLTVPVRSVSRASVKFSRETRKALSIKQLNGGRQHEDAASACKSEHGSLQYSETTEENSKDYSNSNCNTVGEQTAPTSNRSTTITVSDLSSTSVLGLQEWTWGKVGPQPESEPGERANRRMELPVVEEGDKDGEDTSRNDSTPTKTYAYRTLSHTCTADESFDNHDGWIMREDELESFEENRVSERISNEIEPSRDDLHKAECDPTENETNSQPQDRSLSKQLRRSFSSMKPKKKLQEKTQLISNVSVNTDICSSELGDNNPIEAVLCEGRDDGPTHAWSPKPIRRMLKRNSLAESGVAFSKAKIFWQQQIHRGQKKESSEKRRWRRSPRPGPADSQALVTVVTARDSPGDIHAEDGKSFDSYSEYDSDDDSRSSSESSSWDEEEEDSFGTLKSMLSVPLTDLIDDIIRE